MNGRMYDPVLGRMLSPDNYVPDATFTQDYNRYSYARNNPLVYTDPDGNFWNFVIGGVLGGISGWQIGKAQGAKGWGMFGYILGGAAVGVATAGIGQAVLNSFTPAVLSGASGANMAIGAYAASGIASGAFSGAGFAALGGSNINGILKGAFIGGTIGGITGVIGGGIKYGQYRAHRWDYAVASIDPPVKTVDKGILPEVVIRPQGPATVPLPRWVGLGMSVSRGLASILTLPLTVTGDQRYQPNNYTTLYRNMSAVEYQSFVRKGMNFGFGGNSLIDSKQFWTTPEGLEFWNSRTLSGPYNVTISVPTRVIGPYGLAQLQMLDGHLAATVTATNMNAFNRVKIVVQAIQIK